MPKYDPALGFAAQGVPDHPVDTLDKVVEHKLPTKIFMSCAEPSPDGTIRGCPFWYECTMSYKGLTEKEGGGPRNHCWERIKSPGQGGGIVRNVQPCFVGVSQQDIVAQNEEILRPIADEGEEWEELTTIPDTTSMKTASGYEKWDVKLVKRIVQPFQRLGEEKKLAQHELRASIIQREQKKVNDEREAKLLGIKGASTPLDKRFKRSDSVTKKEG